MMTTLMMPHQIDDHFRRHAGHHGHGQFLHHRQNQRQRDEHRGNLIKHCAQDQIGDQQRRDDRQRRHVEMRDPANEGFRHAAKIEKIREYQRAHDHDVDHAGSGCGFPQPLKQGRPIEPTPRQRKQQRQHGGDRSGFRHREDAAVEAAEHRNHQQDERAGSLDRRPALAHRHPLADRRRHRPEAHNQRNRQQIDGDGHNAGMIAARNRSRMNAFETIQ